VKVLLSWLKEYVDILIDVKKLEEKLFSCGLEVEQLIYLGENLDKIVVGKVTEIVPYEGTHLHKCLLDCGEHGKDLEILTGAENVYKGALVPVALVGASLPNGMLIELRKMQGLTSYGMLCSIDELGVLSNWVNDAPEDGILILDSSSKVGSSIRDALDLDDYIFDISIPANRPDCQSIVGIAREVAAFMHSSIKEPSLSFEKSEVTDNEISINVNDNILCPRYLGHYIYDVKNIQAPLWMKRRLSSCGINSINALVDITNYVLLEIGQPLHAYDLEQINSKKIIVRRAMTDERITTLDENEHKLTSDNLVICDSDGAIGLAGVMGGLNSQISDQTSHVVIESAKFLKDNIRKTSRYIGVRTDASSRFEKGISEYSVEVGLSRSLSLINELNVATISSTSFDLSSGESTDLKEIIVKISDIDKTLGISVPPDEIIKFLTSLQFEVDSIDDNTLNITIPRYREDIGTYQDIAEEIIREYGYNNLIPSFLNHAQVTNGGLTFEQKKIIETKEILSLNGYYEVLTIALFSPKELDPLLIAEDAIERNAVNILNPLNENLSHLRTLMAPSMLQVIAENIKSDNLKGKIFEIANVYIPHKLPIEEPPKENTILALGTFGFKDDFFEMKRTIETLAYANGLTFKYRSTNNIPYLHPGKTASIYCHDIYIGHFGKLRYEVVESFNISEGQKSNLSIYLAEIDYAALESKMKRSLKYTTSNKFKSINRDLSIVLDDSIEYGTVVDEIFKSSKNIEDVAFVDIYKSEKFGNDKKSMTFTVTLSSETNDITSEVANETFIAIINNLSNTLNAQIRD
jgi:phenylalanyl-tRNA synthetase beta chain